MFYAHALDKAHIVVDIDEPLYYHIFYKNSLSQGCFDDRKYTEIVDFIDSDFFVIGSDQVWNSGFFQYGLFCEKLFMLKGIESQKNFFSHQALV